jgi:hypothetical protein
MSILSFLSFMVIRASPYGTGHDDAPIYGPRLRDHTA